MKEIPFVVEPLFIARKFSFSICNGLEMMDEC